MAALKLADNLIAHLNTVVTSISDPFLASRYAGFVSVAAATVYELAIKEIFFRLVMGGMQCWEISQEIISTELMVE